MPLCARCTGIWIGGILALIYVIMFSIQFSYKLLVISIALVLPTTIDGFSQLLSNRESTNFIRLTTGFIGGSGLVVFTRLLKHLIF